MREIKPKTDEYMESGPIGMMKKAKAEKKYPKINLSHEFFPETKNWKVGKTYNIELKVKMTGLSISKFDNSSDFEIHGFDSESTKSEANEKEE